MPLVVLLAPASPNFSDGLVLGPFFAPPFLSEIQVRAAQAPPQKIDRWPAGTLSTTSGRMRLCTWPREDGLGLHHAFLSVRGEPLVEHHPGAGNRRHGWERLLRLQAVLEARCGVERTVSPTRRPILTAPADQPLITTFSPFLVGILREYIGACARRPTSVCNLRISRCPAGKSRLPRPGGSGRWQLSGEGTKGRLTCNSHNKAATGGLPLLAGHSVSGRQFLHDFGENDPGAPLRPRPDPTARCRNASARRHSMCCADAATSVPSWPAMILFHPDVGPIVHARVEEVADLLHLRRTCRAATTPSSSRRAREELEKKGKKHLCATAARRGECGCCSGRASAAARGTR